MFGTDNQKPKTPTHIFDPISRGPKADDSHHRSQELSDVQAQKDANKIRQDIIGDRADEVVFVSGQGWNPKL